MAMGFLMLFIAGVCQGSFGLGYKKYAPFSWAAFWGVYNILCIITALGFAWLSVHELPAVIAGRGLSYWAAPALCGALWGLSAVGFSKGISKIGMSMVYGISMGVSTAVGSVVPMLLGGNLPSGGSAALFAVGLALTLAGVAVITAAGVRRDGKAKGSVLGAILALASGLGSGAMNVGFAYSEDVGAYLTALGYSQAAVSGVKWLPVLIGGCVMGMIWCAAELSLRREWGTVAKKGAGSRTVKLFAVSIVWYAALLIYGLASEALGEMGSSIGWILFNSLALVISVCWGLKIGEWKGKSKTLLMIGCIIMIIAWLFTAAA